MTRMLLSWEEEVSLNYAETAQLSHAVSLFLEEIEITLQQATAADKSCQLTLAKPGQYWRSQRRQYSYE